MTKRILCFLAGVIIIATTTTALSTIPAAKTLEYDGGEPHSFNVSVSDTDPSRTTITIPPGSEDVLTVTDTERDQNELAATITASPPEGLQPGTHEYTATIQEEPRGGGVQAKPQLQLPVYVDVPRQGQHLDAELFTQPTTNTVSITANTERTGTQPVNDATITIKASDEDNTDTVLSETTTISAHKRFTTTWTPPGQGTYTVTVQAGNDQTTASETTTVRYGDTPVTVANVNIASYDDNVIHLELTSTNDWNQRIDATPSFRLEDNGTPITRSEATPFTVDPGETAETDFFIDTADVPNGLYTATIQYNTSQQGMTSSNALLRIDDEAVSLNGVTTDEETRLTPIVIAALLLLGVFITAHWIDQRQT